MKQQPHNPDYKLIETNIFNGTSFLDLVYGISNEGENEGLEVYYKKENEGHFHKSRHWLTNDVPNMYKKYFDALKELRHKVENGNKAVININDLLGR